MAASKGKRTGVGCAVLAIVGIGSLSGLTSCLNNATEPTTTASTSASAAAVLTAPATVSPPPGTPPTVPSPPSVPPPTLPSAPNTTSALAALDTLPVKGRAPKTGYTRDQFGDSWLDLDRNGCDARNDVLQRDLTDAVIASDDCRVLSGTLTDPYTGLTMAFVRGEDTSSEVQIDHVVALSDAWQKGAQQLSEAQREAFANDPLNLLAVEGSVNQAKGDGDAATWLPPQKAYRCAYVARQVAVKQRYAIWLTAAEYDAIARILSTCPDQPLPG